MASSSSNFQFIFNASLQAYENKTKNKLVDHPLAAQLQSCNSPNAVLAVLQGLVEQFDQSHTSDRRLMNWLNPTVNVLYRLSTTLGGVGLVSFSSLSLSIYALMVIYQAMPPVNLIFTGIGVLLHVSALVNHSMEAIMTLASLRLQRMWMEAKTYSSTSLNTLNFFSGVSRFTQNRQHWHQTQ